MPLHDEGVQLTAARVLSADKDFPGYFDADQLYDLNADPNEQHNLAADPAQRDRLAQMKTLLRDYCSVSPEFSGIAAGA